MHLDPQVAALGFQHPQSLPLGTQAPLVQSLGPLQPPEGLAAMLRWDLLVSELLPHLVSHLPLVVPHLVVEGSADLHSSHQLLALLVQQHQAMPLVRQHSKAAMPLVVQLSNQALLEDLSRPQDLEEDLGALGHLLAPLLQLNPLHRQILACGQCADNASVKPVYQTYDIDNKRHCACVLHCKQIICAQPVVEILR